MQSKFRAEGSCAEEGARFLRKLVFVILLSWFAILGSGCANDAFLPPPEVGPYGEQQPEDTSPEPLQPPPEL
ncbi:MAG TPA: hypothetical protein VGF73_06390 [Chthoniobacterales bacterium]